MSDGWSNDSRPVEELIWRLSGFSGGTTVAFDLAGPYAATASVRYFEMWRIGRDPALCQFVVPGHETSVSRVHAQLNFVPGTGISINDLNSGNGTYLNGERLIGGARHVLQIGDTLRLGHFTLSVSHPC
ncbi:MAG: FHA domain-containing protein [Hyphomicrobiaceae bacterium]|nr:FHA domain-containing protein [Hyphomicrobiaceae bacterium]